jgi:hypothetical protein
MNEFLRFTLRYFFDHLVKLGFDLRFEVGFDLVNLGKLSKRPAAVLFEVVHAGHPVSIHRCFFVFGVFTAVAFDFDNQVQLVVITVTVVHPDNEIG